MYELKLNWKEFNLCMNSIEAWLKANAGDNYRGNSADRCLHLWFDEKPSEEVLSAISSYWDGLSEESDEVSAYKTMDQIKAEKAAKKESGKTKLLALGLTADEIAAIVG